MARSARSAGVLFATLQPQAVGEWVVPSLQLTSGVTVRIELASTLPPGVRGGGVFGVDPSGAPLPAGVTLSAEGALVVDAAAASGTTVGIVFNYTEP